MTLEEFYDEPVKEPPKAQAQVPIPVAHTAMPTQVAETLPGHIFKVYDHGCVTYMTISADGRMVPIDAWQDQSEFYY